MLIAYVKAATYKELLYAKMLFFFTLSDVNANIDDFMKNQLFIDVTRTGQCNDALHDVEERLKKGDTLVLKTLHHLGSVPEEVVERIKKLTSQGVSIISYDEFFNSRVFNNDSGFTMLSALLNFSNTARQSVVEKDFPSDFASLFLQYSELHSTPSELLRRCKSDLSLQTFVKMLHDFGGSFDGLSMKSKSYEDKIAEIRKSVSMQIKNIVF